MAQSCFCSCGVWLLVEPYLACAELTGWAGSLVFRDAPYDFNNASKTKG